MITKIRTIIYSYKKKRETIVEKDILKASYKLVLQNSIGAYKDNITEPKIGREPTISHGIKILESMNGIGYYRTTRT